MGFLGAALLRGFRDGFDFRSSSSSSLTGSGMIFSRFVSFALGSALVVDLEVGFVAPLVWALRVGLGFGRSASSLTGSVIGFFGLIIFAFDGALDVVLVVGMVGISPVDLF